MILTNEIIHELANYLHREETSAATQEKHLQDIRAFCEYTGSNEISKELVVEWK